MIHESIYQEISSALTALGWFDPGRNHSPISFVATGVPDFESVDVNTAVLSQFDAIESEDELGSRFTEHRLTYYFDFFAEDEAIGTHFIQDAKDVISGRIAAVGREKPHFPVYDYTQATPTLIFYVGVENVFADRPSVYDRPWQRYFRTIRFDVIDRYGSDTDA